MFGLPISRFNLDFAIFSLANKTVGVSIYEADRGRVLYAEVCIMPTDNKCLLTLHGSLFGGKQTILFFETCGQPQNLNRVLDFCSLYSYFDSLIRIKRLLGFHHFEPILDRFFNIGKGFLAGLPLREASRKSEYLGYVIFGFILFN